MEEALLEMKFDAKKNPLGKLSSAQIKAGYAALKDIETYIKANNFNAAFIEANNTYYTRSIFIRFYSLVLFYLFSST
jgi:poly [ADP-ribose] polymerase